MPQTDFTCDSYGTQQAIEHHQQHIPYVRQFEEAVMQHRYVPAIVPSISR